MTAIVATVSLAATGAVVAGTTAANAAPGCYAADTTVERWEDPRGVVMFTTDDAQEADAAASGFTATGDAFAVASQPAKGLVPLYDAYRTTSGNHAWIIWDREYRNVVNLGWEGRGAIGYVSPTPLADCDSVAITRGVKESLHTVVIGDEEKADAAADGYRIEYSWYAPVLSAEPTPEPVPTTAPSPTAQPTPTAEPTPTPEPTPDPTPVDPAPPVDPQPPVEGDGDGLFTVATYPDTQQEVFSWSGSRFRDRSEWLVEQRQQLDLRFVVHTGDVVNWDADSHDQYVNAEAAMDPLEEAGIPYQLSIGNHDTMATGPGGGARDSKRTREYQRTTTTFNQFFRPSDYSALKGTFEQGKVDNTYSVFEAEGATWLVLNLELWPRESVVDWAEGVIDGNPRANVIIQTHSFLDANANIDGAGQSLTRWSYGDSSPQYIYDRLVAPYGNVKVVTSGHVGAAASKVVTTAAGNKVAYMLQAIHSNTDNPVRLSQFDVNAGKIDTKVYSPEDGVTWDANSLTGLSFIKD
ncbi:hypothetical protein CVS47_00184 [Microbacterium lemovicicum]|uniref:Uncharacterized protein n=2 Tax=Microbacterium lemovicicum TaxID=1072463 RepID=A0A3Q9IXY8_9MICO|nr:hypothetical protein CVS47_00184 [Microbacterium lemovicicum]